MAVQYDFGKTDTLCALLGLLQTADASEAVNRLGVQTDNLLQQVKAELEKMPKAQFYSLVDLEHQPAMDADMQRIISREKSAATKERQEAQDAYIKDPTSENKQRLKDLGIKEKDVQKEATKKNQTREERTQGTVPKKDKDKYKPLTDFMKE